MSEQRADRPSLTDDGQAQGWRAIPTRSVRGLRVGPARRDTFAITRPCQGYLGCLKSLFSCYCCCCFLLLAVVLPSLFSCNCCCCCCFLLFVVVVPSLYIVAVVVAFCCWLWWFLRFFFYVVSVSRFSLLGLSSHTLPPSPSVSLSHPTPFTLCLSP